MSMRFISPRRRTRLPFFVLLLAPRVGAQESVTGQLSILERSGTRTTDLANAVIWLEPASPRGAPATTTQIVMASRTFTPRQRVVAVGSTVQFPNQDPFRHNVFSKSGPAEFDLGLYGRGESKGSRVERAGVYPIFCNIHAKMVAFVVAVATPYVTQAGVDGRFTIDGVPPGKYTLNVWHDRGGEHSRAHDVVAGSPANVSIQLDARSHRVVQHKNKFGQEYTNTGRDRY